MHKDEYLQSMKQAIDESIKEDEKIQQFLVWLHEKTTSLGFPYQEAALRAFYCDVVEGIKSDRHNVVEGITSVNRKISRMLDSNLDKDIDKAREIASRLMESEYDGITYNSSTFHKNQLLRLISQVETLPASKVAFDKDAAIACKQPYRSHIRHYPEKGYLGRAIALLVRSSDCDFRREMISIMNTFPNTAEWGDGYIYEIRLEEWRERLSSCLSCYRDLKLDWQFSDEQKQLLNNYYAANKLVLDCIRESNASPEVQKEIQETLLLPIAEIKKRKSGNR